MKQTLTSSRDIRHESARECLSIVKSTEMSEAKS